MRRAPLLLASLALSALPVLGLGAPALAAETPTPSPPPTEPTAEPTPSPTSCQLVGCVPTTRPTPTRTATPAPTAVPTTAAPTYAPTPVRTYVQTTSSPRPRVTEEPEEVLSTAPPVTGGPELGAVTPATATPAPTKAPATVKAAEKRDLGSLAALVVGGAVLLGVGGGAGLYLTRHS